MPRLRVSPFYRQMLGHNGSPEARGYIQEKMRAAAWLIKSIHQRQRTLYMVTSSIAKFQREFLEHGVSQLRPLVLKDVANDIGMHESTVSRATAGKYVHTPQGTFELKYFFTSSLRSGHGEEVSAESVKEQDPDHHRQGGRPQAAERPVHRRAARQGADRHRAAHRGEVPGADGHPAVVQAQAGVLDDRWDARAAEGLMQITVTFRHVDPTPALRTYAEDKVDAGRAEVPSPSRSTPTSSSACRRSATSPRSRSRRDHVSMFAKETTHDLYSAIDLAVEKLEHQAQKLKARRSERKGAAAPRSGAVSDGRARAPASRRARVIETRRVSAKPMSVDDAIGRLERSADEFLVFTNEADQRLAVLYRRKDGRYGLIVAAARQGSGT